MRPLIGQRPSASAPRLWCEVAAIYLLGQLALWVALPYANLYAMIAAFTLVAILLLEQTPGFRWRTLWNLSSLRGHWGLLGLSSIVLAGCIVPLALLLPDARFLSLPNERPILWLMILALYPWFSVLGQEIIYRTLFFARYEHLFPNALTAGLFNILAFGIAHAFFERWATFVMSLAAGAVFTFVYMRSRSFPAVFLIHWIAGGLVFTFGLGVYFYHGAIAR